MSVIELGDSIPSLTSHAVSVSLPTWADNVGYEEGDRRVVDKMTTGYPRFFIHKSICALADAIIARYGSPNQKAMLFPSPAPAQRCRDFIKEKGGPDLIKDVEVIDLTLDKGKETSEIILKISPSISAVIYHSDLFPVAKQYWQHSGDGISSRRAEFCHSLFVDGKLVPAVTPQPVIPQKRGPRRYQRGSIDLTSTPTDKKVSPERVKDAALIQESTQFLEDRFGRNLDLSFIDNAKISLRRRIAGSLTGDVNLAEPKTPEQPSDSHGATQDDVYLYPCGMNAIFSAHRMLLQSRGQLKSISFGFPYVDTLKILQKFGPGCIFYGHGSSEDLDDLEARLQAGEKYLALFCEFPGNPLLKCPDLKRIRKLADTYDFAVVVDDTIGTSINVHVLPYADVVVSSLTKIFSGDCNVMGGSAILNPQGRYYDSLKKAYEADHKDNTNYWAEDIIFMERNSRDFINRIKKINHTTEAICDLLKSHPLVKDVYYPKYSSTKQFYEDCRTPEGGYGGLLSFFFHKKEHAIAFYDRIETAKGPSLGTNFTLTSPYVLLAHYWELEWAGGFGVPPDLIRVSVGVEDTEELVSRFVVALKAAEAADS